MTKKISTRIICAFLALVMVFLMLPMAALAQATEALGELFSSLTPGPSTVTLVYTAEELDNIREDLDGTYVLMNDIDLSDSAYKDNWVPIGSVDEKFTGTLLGGGHAIKGLNISSLPEAASDGYCYVGLFGYNDGDIRDLRIEGNVSADTTGKRAIVGTLVGYNNKVIKNCSDGVTYNDFILTPESLHTTMYNVAEYLNDPNTEDNYVVGNTYATSFYNEEYSGNSTTYDDYSTLTLTVSDNELPSVYIILNDVYINNFRLESDTTKDVYIVSLGSPAGNYLRAQDSQRVINLPNANLTILGNAPLSIEGRDGRDAINVKGLYVDTTSSLTVKGGDGADGTDGVSYNITDGASSTAHGGSGTGGNSGGAGIKCEYMTVYNAESITVTGGNGGNGGNGGDGRGVSANVPGGAGGDGGNGASGGHAIYAVNKFNNLSSSVKIELKPGDGGNGGNGGNGGQSPFKKAGNGGNGGGGGQTNYALYTLEFSSASIIDVLSHKAGNGGNGGNGGRSAAIVGLKGTCGFGGAGGGGGTAYVIYGADKAFFNIKAESGKGGDGGAAGQKVSGSPNKSRSGDGGRGGYVYINGQLTFTATTPGTGTTEYGAAGGYGTYGGCCEEVATATVTETAVTHAALTYGTTCGYSSVSYKSYMFTYTPDWFAPARYDSDYTLVPEANAYYYGTDDNPYAILMYASGTDIGSSSIHEDTEVIYHQAFQNRTKITSITIPDNVKAIGDEAFTGCTALVNLAVKGDGLRGVGDKAFYGNTALKSVTLPDEMEYIGDYAFAGCSSLTEFRFPYGITEIPEGVLGAYSATGTWTNCKNLKTVYVPETVTVIDYRAFYKCSQLKSVVFEGESELTRIADSAFSGCSLIENINLPESLTTIESHAFEGTASLKNIFIPKNVTSIGYEAYRGASALENIAVHTDNTVYKSAGNMLVEKASGKAILGCNSSVILGSGVTEIATSAFVGAHFATPLAIPASVGIASGAFVGCSGEVILLHAEGTALSSGFTGCSELVFYAREGVVESTNLYEIVVEGDKIGENAYYIVYDMNQAAETDAKSGSAMLLVYGTGSTYNYASAAASTEAFYSKVSKALNEFDKKSLTFTHITVADGITGIGDYTFDGFKVEPLVHVRLGKDVKFIGNNNFEALGTNRYCSIYFEGDCPLIDKDAIHSFYTQKVSLICDEDTHGWSYNGAPYVCYIPGVGLSTSFPTDGVTYYFVDSSENLNFVDANGNDKYGVIYEIDTNGTESDISDDVAYVKGYKATVGAQKDIRIPLQILKGGVKYNVVEIGEGAFKNVTNLKTVTLQVGADGIAEIGKEAFVGCTATVHIIGNNDGIVAADDSFDSYVVVDDGATDWGESFGGATVYVSSSLEGNTDKNGMYYTVNVQDGTAIVGKKSSTTDTSLNEINTSGATAKKVEIPNFVTYNGSVYMVVGFDRYAFYGNKTVESIEFGRFIGVGQTIELPAIWDCTFRDTDSLASIKVTDNEFYKTVGESGVLYGSPLNPEDEDAVFTRLIKYPENKTDATFTSPAASENVIITVIESYAFAGNDYITAVNVPTMNVIGSHAFWNCTNLETLVGEYHVHALGDSAFENTALTGFEFTDTLSTIGERAFYNTALSGDGNGRIEINHNVVYIGEGAFGRCSDIAEFGFRDFGLADGAVSANVTGKYHVDSEGALYEYLGADTYKLLQFPSARSHSGESFAYDMNAVTLPASAGGEAKIFEIASEAFYGARYLKEITVSDDTAVIGSQAFASSKRLEKVTLGKSYYGSKNDKGSLEARYSYNLFVDSGALEYIEVSSENQYFTNDSNGVLYSKEKDVLYCYPAAIQRVNFNVPASVEKIYDSAFYGNTSIKQVVVGAEDSIYIGSRAFGSCTNLASVYFVSKNAPVAAEKIYDNTSEQLTTYYKSEYAEDTSSSWHAYYTDYEQSSVTWCERKICAYSVVSEVPNETVNTNDYLIYIKATDTTALEGVYVIVTAYTADTVERVIEYPDGTTDTVNETVIIAHKFYMTSDEAGRVAFSTLANGKEIAYDIHIYAYKESYYTYDYDLHLDSEMLITYLTMAKEPDVFGVDCDGKDINSQTVDVNLSEYVENYKYAELNDKGEYTSQEIEKTTYSDVVITVLGFWDPVYSNPVYTLVQGEREIPAVSKIEGTACTFTVSSKELIPDLPLEVRLSVTNPEKDKDADDYELSCRKVINVNVIEFNFEEDDVKLDFEAPVDFGGLGGADIFTMLFGSDGFDLKLGKNIKLNTRVDGSQAILTLTGEKNVKSKSTNFKEEYYKYRNPHDKGTYFYQYYDGFLTYNIRFVPTDVNDYYYYRVYVYHGAPGIKYNDALIKDKAVYGAFNLTTYETALKGREQVRARSLVLFADVKAWIAKTYFEHQQSKEQFVNDLLSGNLGVFDAYQKYNELAGGAKYEKYKPCWQEKYSKKDNMTAENKHSFSVGFEGQLVFEYDGEGVRLSSGSIKGTISYTFQHNSQYVIWVIPVTLEVEVTLSGEVVLRLAFDMDEQDRFTTAIDELSVTLKAEIEASVGIGCSVASVGVYGKMGTVFILDIFPSVYIDQWDADIRSWKLYGEFGAYVKILWYKKQFKIWEDEYYIIGGDDKAKAAYVRAQRSKMFLAESYEYTADCNESATIIKIGSDYYKLHFAIAEGEAYDAYNCTKLHYALWNESEGKWGESVMIDDNGFSDAAYSVVSEGGSVYVAYTQQTKKLTAEEAEDTYSGAEGLSMKFVDVSDGFAEIGAGELTTVISGAESSHYKYAQQISVYNGAPVIAWVENADNNIFGVSPDNYYDDATGDSGVYGTAANSVMVSFNVDGEWQTACVADGLSSVVDMAIYGDRLYYVVDGDGDLTDGSDCTMYVRELGDGIDTESVKFNEVGSITSIDVTDGIMTYYYSDGSGEGVRALDYTGALPEMSAMLANGYKTLTDESGKITAFLYTDVATDADDGSSCSRILGVFLDGDEWGAPVCVYDAHYSAVTVTEYSNGVAEESVLDTYISSYDAELIDGKIILSVQLCNDEGISLARVTEYPEYPDGIAVSGASAYDPTEISVSTEHEINYSEQTVTFTFTNRGAMTATVTVGEESITVGSGTSGELTVSIPTVDYTYGIKIENAYGKTAEQSVSVNSRFVDLKPIAKQIVIGESNSFLVAVRNYGNIAAAEGGRLYVLSGTLTDDVNEKTAEDMASLVDDALYTVDLKAIGANRIAYYEIKLDSAILNGSEGIITLYVEHSDENGQSRENNIASYYLCDVTQTVDGSIQIPEGIAPEIYSDNTDYYKLDEATPVYVEAVSAPNTEISLTFGGAALTEGVEYTVSSESAYTRLIAINPEYLNTLATGKYTLAVRFIASDAGTTELTLDISVKEAPEISPDDQESFEDKKYMVSWSVDGTVTDEQYAAFAVPEYSGTPTKDGFRFVGWDGPDADSLADGALAPVTADVTYTAVFEEAEQTYTVTWVLWRESGTTVVTTVKAGEIPVCRDSSFNGITIQGWSDEDGNATVPAAATENATYYAVYLELSGIVTVEGSASVGGTLTLNTEGVVGDSFTYSWYADGVQIAGATYPTLTVIMEYVGAEIYCKLTGAGDYIGSIVSDTVTVSKHSHNMLYFSEQLPTCEHDGNREYWYCQSCDIYFADAQCDSVYTRDETILAATGHSYKATVTAPTCTSRGYTTHECEHCAHTYFDTHTDTVPHTESDWIIDVTADCTRDGSKHTVCEVCGKLISSEVIGKTGHTESDWITDTPASCDKVGARLIECTVCLAVLKTEELGKLAHTMGAWTQTKAPACETDGEESRKCENCTYTETRVTNKLGHSYESEWTVDKAPTCTELGSESRHCVNCDAVTDRRDIQTLPHEASDWIIDVYADCTRNGSKHTVCVVCGRHLETESITRTGHKEGVWITDKEPTCTGEGSRHIECTVCLAILTTDVIAQLSHTEGDWIIDKAPTCELEGARHTECVDCKTTLSSEQIDATGHKIGDWTELTAPTCETDGEEARVCENCTYTETRVTNKLGHSYESEWTVDKAPTCTEPGSESRHCSACDATADQRAIEALGHSYGEGSVVIDARADSVGIMLYTCGVCANERTEEIEKTEPTITEAPKVFGKWKGDNPVFRSNADYKDFVGVRLNGELLPEDAYTITEGSTVITLNEDFAKSLENGEYTLEIVSVSGTARATFTVENKILDNPVVWYSGIGVIAVAVIAVAFWLILRKRRI